jgi:septal ring factor EnvC (AmiA/AmiB activator)
MNTKLKFVAYTLILIYLTGSAFCGNKNIAVTVADNKEQLIKEEIDFLKSKVKILESKTKSLNNEIELLERKREILIKEKTLILKQKKEVELKLKDLQMFLKDTKKEITAKQNYLNKRILELYKKGEFIVPEIVLFPESEESLIHSLNTFHYLNNKDKNAIKQLSKLIKEKKTAEIRLANSREVLKKKLNELTLLQQNLRKTYKARKKIFKNILNRKKEYAKLLKERNNLLKDLMTAIENKKTAYLVPEIPIVRFKKLLSLPVKGKIIEKFGKIRNRKFGTYLKNNGITIKVKKGTKVKAFYDGTVVFADWFKSYGKLVIIDHKEGYFSFYAHLDSFSVKINQTVLKGDVIGKTGNTASLKGNILHFELWHKKKPLNPLKWIKLRRK